eukprot:9198819-Prorocentrum_lima.AAC.1
MACTSWPVLACTSARNPVWRRLTTLGSCCSECIALAKPHPRPPRRLPPTIPCSTPCLWLTGSKAT